MMMERITKEGPERRDSEEVDLAALSREIASYDLRAEHKYWELERQLSKGNRWEALQHTAGRLIEKLRATLMSCMVGVLVAQGMQLPTNAERHATLPTSNAVVVPPSVAAMLEAERGHIVAPDASELLKCVVENIDGAIETSTGTWSVSIRDDVRSEQLRADLRQVGSDVLFAVQRVVAGQSPEEIARLKAKVESALNRSGEIGDTRLSTAELEQVAATIQAIGEGLDTFEDKHERLVESLGELQMAAVAVGTASANGNPDTTSTALAEFIRQAHERGIKLTYEPEHPTVGQQNIR